MSDKLDLLFRAPRVITAAGEVARCIGVRDGRIVVIEPIDAELDAEEVVELGDDEVLIPGLVDTHVHVNEPGRTEWEGFASATRAAAAGGVTTIVDMPLNSIPPTVDVEALAVKRRVAADQAYVDVGFWGGAVPGNVPDLRGLHDAGVFGFKCFLLHSGVDEFPPLDPEGLELALKEIASFGAMMIVHAEDAQRNRPCGLAQGRQLHRLPVVATSRRREPRDRRGHRTGEVDGLPGAYPASIQLRRTSDDRVRAPGRRQTHGGDVPALSVVRVGRDSGGRDSVQVLSTDPRGRPTGNCCGRAWPTVSSTVS